MRRGRHGGCRRRARGFTLFEMVVVICLIVMLYMVAEQRLNELPAAAERASFYGVLAQVKTGINLEMLARLSSDGAGRAGAMEGINPMLFLLETPGNYRGEVDTLEARPLQPASWYYDRARRELVYVVGEASREDVRVIVAGTPVNMGIIRLRLTSEGDGRGWQGLVLAPVAPFEWERRAEQPVELNG